MKFVRDELAAVEVNIQNLLGSAAGSRAPSDSGRADEGQFQPLEELERSTTL